MKIVGLVSSFREGPLLGSALRSLAALDYVAVFEGPVDGNPATGEPSQVSSAGAKFWSWHEGAWKSDADKRTAMVEWVQTQPWSKFRDNEIWGLWLDGDEILLWGEYLHDWLAAAVDEAQTDGNLVVGWPLSLVEMDGTVSWCMGKLVRIDQVRRYLISSSYLELVSGRNVTVGNVPAWDPVNGPAQFLENPDTGERRPHWRARPPLQGEPHLQHRWKLRSQARQVERQSVAEARSFEGVELT